ncbi:MAG: hypothetical protein MHM6MM_003924 [Cercozoa sp. M6MM]
MALYAASVTSEPVSLVVLDTAVFLLGDTQVHNLGADTRYVTTPGVVSEVRDEKARRLFETFPYPIEVRSPSNDSLQFVRQFAAQTGDLSALSAVDLGVLALAHEFELSHNGMRFLRESPKTKLPVAPKAAGANAPTATATTRPAAEKRAAPLSSLSSRPVRSLCVDDLLFLTAEEFERKHPPLSADAVQAEESATVEPDKEKKQQEQEHSHEESEENEEEKQEQVDETPKVGTPKTVSFAAAVAAAKPAKEEEDDGFMEVKRRRRGRRRKQHERGSLRAAWERAFEQGDWVGTGADDDNNKASTPESPDTPAPTPASESVSGDSKAPNSGSGPREEVSTIACVTTDYSMQNVMLQMGLRLLAVSGRTIRQVKQWVQRCYACLRFTTTDANRRFCGKCGSPTLVRACVVVDKRGQVHYRMPTAQLESRRGKKFSIPAPVSGKQAALKNFILREDDWKEAQRRARRQGKSRHTSTHHSASDAMAMEFGLRPVPQMRVRTVIGAGSRNPNKAQIKRKGRNRRRK